MVKKALVVVDIQNDFVTGSLGTPEAVAIIDDVNAKVNEYKQAGADIIYTRDTHYENYLETTEGKHLPIEHCIIGTDGWQIHDDAFIGGSKIINKPTFGWDGWLENRVLDGYEEIEMIGICTDICVLSNALIIKSQYPDLPITVDPKCCAGLTPDKHDSALDVLESCQVTVSR